VAETNIANAQVAQEQVNEEYSNGNDRHIPPESMIPIPNFPVQVTTLPVVSGATPVSGPISVVPQPMPPHPAAPVDTPYYTNATNFVPQPQQQQQEKEQLNESEQSTPEPKIKDLTQQQNPKLNLLIITDVAFAILGVITSIAGFKDLNLECVLIGSLLIYVAIIFGINAHLIKITPKNLNSKTEIVNSALGFLFMFGIYFVIAGWLSNLTALIWIGIGIIVLAVFLMGAYNGNNSPLVSIEFDSSQDSDEYSPTQEFPKVKKEPAKSVMIWEGNRKISFKYKDSHGEITT